MGPVYDVDQDDKWAVNKEMVQRPFHCVLAVPVLVYGHCRYVRTHKSVTVTVVSHWLLRGRVYSAS